MKAKTRVIRSTRSSQQPGGITINTNTIMGLASTLIGGVVLYMVTTGMGKVSQTSNDVRDVKTVLPFMQHAIDSQGTEIKQANSVIGNLTTKTELEQKHSDLQLAIKDSKTDNEKHFESLAGELKEVKIEQGRVREDLMKQPPRRK